MPLVKQNIWTLFYFIIGVSLTLLLSICFITWHNLYNLKALENENFTKLIAKNTQSFLQQTDMLLTVKGQRLAESSVFSNQRRAEKILEQLMASTPHIVGYSLYSVHDGSEFSNSMNKPERFTNLIFSKETRQSFYDAQLSTDIVIDKTTSFSNGQRYGFPVRKAVRDDNGEVLFVLSVIVDANKHSIMDEEFLKSDSNIILLMRHADRYRQLYIYKSRDDYLRNAYEIPLPLEAYQSALRTIEIENNVKIADVFEQEMAVSFPFKNRVNQHYYLMTAKFIKRYQMWATSYLPMDEIITEFIIHISIYIALFLALSCVFYLLFKRLEYSNNERLRLVESAAYQDYQTGLPNRYFLVKKVTKWLKTQSSFAIIFIDVDNFKSINDQFGHMVGDEVLKAVAQRLNSTLDKDEFLVRQGGDEFLLFTSRADDIEQRCTEVIQHFKAPFNVNMQQFYITVSMGASLYPDDDAELDNLIVNANIALYEAKGSSNAFVLYNSDLKENILKTARIKKHLVPALYNKEFSLVYQPQVNKAGVTIGVEALLRWHNNKLGQVAQEVFISIAEKMGLMGKIGEFIIQQSLYDVSQLIKMSGQPLRLSINVSAQQLLNDNFEHYLMSQVQHYKFPVSLLTIEITESLFINDLSRVLPLLHNIRSQGIAISLDDFGTGYSSLSMLHKLPLNEVKVDKSFVDNLTESTVSQHMIKTIVSIGESLAYDSIVVEGVETQAQLELLQSYGCETMQGYYFSKPLTIIQLASYMQEKTNTNISPPII